MPPTPLDCLTRRRCLWPSLVLAALLSAYGARLVSPPPDITAGALPDIALEDLAGNAVALKRLTRPNTPTVIYLWASGCAGCAGCADDLARLARAAQDRSLRVILINQGDDLLPTVRYLDGVFATAEPPFMQVLRDPGQRLMAALGVRRLPVTLRLGD